MTRVKMPDGTIANFPDSMPNEEIEAALSAHESGYSAAPAPAPNPKTDLMPVDSSAIYKDVASKVSRFGQGVVGGLQRMRGAVESLPVDPNLPPEMRQQIEAQRAEHGASLENYNKNIAPTLDTAGRIGEGTPEVAMTILPAARLSTGIAPLLTRALGRAAPIAADVGLNAGYEGTKSAVRGNGITDIMKDAGTGGLAAGVGAMGGGLLQRGFSPAMPATSRKLIENDIIPSYGQMFGRTGSKIEDIGTFAPVVGTALSRSRNVAMRDYSRAEVNQALKPLGVSTKEFGEDAVTGADRLISKTYDTYVPQTYVQAIDAQNAITKSNLQFERTPLLTEPQIKQVNRYVEEKIQPELSLSQQTDNRMPGRTARDIDIELGTYARKYLESPNPADHELGGAFRQLQANLRDVLQTNNPDALVMIKKSNEAFRNLLPAEKASRASKNIGEFTPEHMKTAADFYNIDLGGKGGLNRAGRELLTGSGGQFRTAAQVGGGLATGFGDAGLTLAGIGAAHTIASRPVRKLVATGVLPKRLMKMLPFTAAQLGARIAADQTEGD